MNLSQCSQVDNLVVGYQGYVCKDCLIIHPLTIYFGRQGQLVTTCHECIPQRLQDVHDIVDKKDKISEVYAKLPEEMKKICYQMD
jgi:hypothetical protein